MSRLAFASTALLAYTYAGYPVAVALAAKLRPLEVTRDASYEPTVSVLIPAFDAEKHVRPKLESLLAQTYPKEKLEILVYSDASTDGTDREVRAFADRGVRLLRGEARSGKPTALNALREAASGEILVLTDIRQVLSANAVRSLVSRMADPSIGCVSGNLEMTGAAGAGAYWRYEKLIRQLEARFRGTVGVSGALYAIRRSELGELPRDIILDDMWIPFVLRLQGKKIVFEADAVALDEAADDDREKARKVRTLAGNYQLYARMPAILSPLANPSFFETFSHKLLRLAGPFLMAGVVVGTAHGLAFETRPATRRKLAVLAAGSAAFAGLALLGDRAGKLGKLARTFTVMNEAALLGLVKFLRDEQRVTW